jgi:hypothetical protein
MHTPALALAWQLWGRHRRGLAGALVCWLLCAVVAQVLPAASSARHALAMAGLLMMLPLTVSYLIALFGYGFDGTAVEARGSCFPARMFALPVRARALVGWPMLHGAFAVALAWLLWAAFVVRPGGIEVPLWGPAFLLAAVVAGLQAVLWVPFGLPWVRLAAALAVPFGLLTGAATAWTRGVSDPVVACLFACFLPAAYAVAWAGVSRARHGDVPEWWRLGARRPGAATGPRALRPFPSPGRAQLWYEWRLHGIGFPVLLGCLLAGSMGWAVFLARVGGDAIAAGLIPSLAAYTPETCETVLVFHPLVTLPPLVAALGGAPREALARGSARLPSCSPGRWTAAPSSAPSCGRPHGARWRRSPSFCWRPRAGWR